MKPEIESLWQAHLAKVRGFPPARTDIGGTLRVAEKREVIRLCKSESELLIPRVKTVLHRGYLARVHVGILDCVDLLRAQEAAYPWMTVWCWFAIVRGYTKHWLPKSKRCLTPGSPILYS